MQKQETGGKDAGEAEASMPTAELEGVSFCVPPTAMSVSRDSARHKDNGTGSPRSPCRVGAPPRQKAGRRGGL